MAVAAPKLKPTAAAADPKNVAAAEIAVAINGIAKPPNV